MIRATLLAILLLAPAGARTEEIRVAVAANFAETCRAIGDRFTAASGHEVALAAGSTGKLYAQIRHGAPFDVFLAADAHRPELLEREGLALPGSRFTYARGRLVLWSPEPGLVDPAGRVLTVGDFRFLAIANPELAPYGYAARQVLEDKGLWRALSGRLVRGENIGQTFQFVATRNADLGFVAYSQIEAPGHDWGGSRWLVPEDLHSPIDQQAVLLVDGEAPRAFLEYLSSAAAAVLLESHGYEAPRVSPAARPAER